MQVQNSSFYHSITAQTNGPATVIALSVLLIIVGVVMTATSICQLVAGLRGLFHYDFNFIKFIIEIVRITILSNK